MSSIIEHLKTIGPTKVDLVWNSWGCGDLWNYRVTKEGWEFPISTGEPTTKKKARKNGLAWLRRNT